MQQAQNGKNGSASTVLSQPGKTNSGEGSNLERGTSANVLGDLIDPRQYLGVLLQYWWLILLILLLGTAAGVVHSVMAVPLYRASCRYEIFRHRQVTDDNPGRASMDEVMTRQIMLMRSGNLRQRVIERLRPEWQSRLPDGNMSVNLDISRSRELWTMVDIRATSVNREYAVKYLETMLDIYKDLRREEVLEAAERTMTGLRREQASIGTELEAAQEELAQFRREHNITYSQTRISYDERFLANLVQRENSLRMEKLMLDSQFGFLQNADVPTIHDALRLTEETKTLAGAMTGDSTGEGELRSEVGSSSAGGAGMGDGEWQQVEARLARLQAEYQGKLNIFQEQHPRMIALARQIESAERDLALTSTLAVKRLNARRSALEVQLAAVSEAARAWRHELSLTTEQRSEHATLQAKVRHLGELYDRVYTRVLDGTMVDADALFSREVEPIYASATPFWPSIPRIMTIAIMASLGVGVGFAFLLDHFDTRFLDALAIEERLNIPYMSGTPDWNKVIKSFNPNDLKLLVSRDKTDVSTETYRALRASIEFSTGQEGRPYVLLITSGEDGEGKTMTAVNLATLFAWSGKKVLLVDGDLRRGSCHPYFKIKRDPGMCEFFVGKISEWRKLVKPSVETNLDFIPAGTFRNEVPEMLSSARLEQLFSQWRNEYDLVVVDSAPVGRVVDSSFLGKVADGTLLVVRHGKASFGSVRHAVHRLQGSNIVGFSLNGIQLGPRKYSYYNRYGRYYYGRYSYPYGRYHYGSYGAEGKS